VVSMLLIEGAKSALNIFTLCQRFYVEGDRSMVMTLSKSIELNIFVQYFCQISEDR